MGWFWPGLGFCRASEVSGGGAEGGDDTGTGTLSRGAWGQGRGTGRRCGLRCGLPSHVPRDSTAGGKSEQNIFETRDGQGCGVGGGGPRGTARNTAEASSPPGREAWGGHRARGTSPAPRRGPSEGVRRRGRSDPESEFAVDGPRDPERRGPVGRGHVPRGGVSEAWPWPPLDRDPEGTAPTLPTVGKGLHCSAWVGSPHLWAEIVIELESPPLPVTR